jgi:hypothetical protein
MACAAERPAVRPGPRKLTKIFQGLCRFARARSAVLFVQHMAKNAMKGLWEGAFFVAS